MTLEPTKHYTYKELCGLLQQPVLAGGARKHQLKKWETFMTLTSHGNNKGRTYTIESAIGSLEELAELCKTNKTMYKGKWLAPLSKIIVSEIANEVFQYPELRHLYVTSDELVRLAGFHGDAYYEGKAIDNSMVQLDTNVSLTRQYELYAKLDKLFRDTLLDTLDTMKRYGVIDWGVCYKLTNSMFTTREETETINLIIKQQLLKKFGKPTATLYNVYLSGGVYKFYAQTISILKADYGINISSLRKVYFMGYIEGSVPIAKQLLIDNEELYNCKEVINDNVLVRALQISDKEYRENVLPGIKMGLYMEGEELPNSLESIIRLIIPLHNITEEPT